MSNLLDNPQTIEYEDAEEANKDNDWKRSMLFRLVSGREYAYSIMKEILYKSWRPSGILDMTDLGGGIYKVKHQHI